MTTEDAAGLIHTAIEAAPIGILVVESDGTILLVNRELERRFGYQRGELVGRSVDLLLPEAQRSAHAADRAAFALSPEARPMGTRRELFGCRKDGSRIVVEVGLTPVRTEQGLLVFASVADVTDRVRQKGGQSADVAEQLEFQRLLADFSSHFINLPLDAIDDVIRDALGRICRALDIERGTLYRIGPDGLVFSAVSWAEPGVPLIPVPLPAQEKFPWAIQRVLSGEPVWFATVDEIPSEVDRAGFRTVGTRSAAILPLRVDRRVVGAVGFSVVRAERTWPPDVMHRLEVIASVLGQVLARRQREEALRTALAEVERLKDTLEVENEHLRHEVHEASGFSCVVGRSPAVRQVLEQVGQVAATDSTVLLLGETGTGKELFATHIHELSARRGRAMVRVNCAAIPTTLIESELFGREKGAFTGALAHQVGRFEMADGSTIFLDEIGDLPTEAQVKLLRVLEERQFERLGSPRSIPVDTRIVAATHHNLERRIAEGAFREDLYYRLNVFPIRVPPLRDRVDDIPLLVWRFVEEFSRAFGKRVDTIAKESLTALQQYTWPGNIRELRNVVERAMITASGSRLTIPLPSSGASAARRSSKLVDVEKEHIRSVLERTGWRIRGAGGAAERLGLKPTTLETRMSKLGLRRPGHA